MKETAGKGKGGRKEEWSHIITNTHTDTQSFVCNSEIQKVFFFFFLQLIQWYNLILTWMNLKIRTAFIYPPWISWKHFTKQYSVVRTLYWDILYHTSLFFSILIVSHHLSHNLQLEEYQGWCWEGVFDLLIISFSTLPSPTIKHTKEVTSLSLLCQLSL